MNELECYWHSVRCFSKNAIYLDCMVEPCIINGYIVPLVNAKLQHNAQRYHLCGLIENGGPGILGRLHAYSAKHKS